jgi:hypothetical protein
METGALCVVAVGLALASLLPWFSDSPRSDPITPWDAFSLRYFVGGGPSTFRINALGDQRLGPYLLAAGGLLLVAALLPRGPRWGAFLAFLLGAGCVWSIALYNVGNDSEARARPGLWVALVLCGAYLVAGLFVAASRRRRERAETAYRFGPG